MQKYSFLNLLVVVLIILGMDTTAQAAKVKSKPTGLEITPVTLERLDISWQAVDCATGYNIYRGTSKDLAPSDDNLIACTTKNFYSNRDLKPSTTYYYRIAPLLNDKQGQPSAVQCGTTKHKDLALISEGSKLIVEGDAFQITWDGDRGGEITDIKQYDGLNWVKINSSYPSNNFNTVPGYVISDINGNSFQLSRANGAAFERIKTTPDEIFFSVEASPRTEDGRISDWKIKQTFRVFKEGLLFCNLQMELPEGAPPSNVNYAGLGICLDESITSKKFKWGYFTRDLPKLFTWKSTSDQVADNCMYPYVAADWGLGDKSSFTNHVAFFIEEWKALGVGRKGTGKQKETAGCKFRKYDGAGMAYNWTLYQGSENYIQAPYKYSNRWGIGLGAMRKTFTANLSASRGNNLLGTRYCHVDPPRGHPADQSPDDWPWSVWTRWHNEVPQKVYPSDEEIDAAAKLGTNVFVLHQDWMRCGGSNTFPPADYTPQNPKELKRFIQRCHKNGIRVGLYMRAVEAYALYMPYFEQFCQYDFDGLYIDWCSPFAFDAPDRTGRPVNQACFKPSQTHFDTYEFFCYLKMLRKRVGDNGFMIGHSGPAPTILALSVFDTYLPGEWPEQKEHILDSPDMHIYHGMATCCGTTPIEYVSPKDKAVAYGAGLGTYLQNEKGVLWKILSSVPMEKAYLYNNLTENLQVVSSTNPDFYTSVYKIDRDLMLATTANLGQRGSTTLSFDMPTLGLVGKYSITEMCGKDPNSFATEKIGTTDDCVINVGPLDKFEIRGYKFNRIK